MTKRTGFPTVSLITTLLAVALMVFLLIVPRNYLLYVTAKLRASAQEANRAILAEDFAAACTALDGMFADFSEAEQPLKLFLNHEEVDELRAALYAARTLGAIEESGNLLTEIQIILRILDYWDDTETLSIYNLF